MISPFLSTLALNDLQFELKDFCSEWKNLNKTIKVFRHITEFLNEIKDDSDNSNENKYYEKCELSNNTHGESNCINCLVELILGYFYATN